MNQLLKTNFMRRMGGDGSGSRRPAYKCDGGRGDDRMAVSLELKTEPSAAGPCAKEVSTMASWVFGLRFWMRRAIPPCYK